MADVHNKATRSYNMSRIKGKNTGPELLIRKFLHSNGFRYKLHDKRLPGKPDIVLPKYRTIVLINGCFWHGHEKCDRSALPKTRTEWWKLKINKNIANDQKVIRSLDKLGWRVLVVWTCTLRSDLINQALEEVKNNILKITKEILYLSGLPK